MVINIENLKQLHQLSEVIRFHCIFFPHVSKVAVVDGGDLNKVHSNEPLAAFPTYLHNCKKKKPKCLNKKTANGSNNTTPKKTSHVWLKGFDTLIRLFF